VLITYASVALIVGQPQAGMGSPAGLRFTPYAVLENATAQRLTVTPALKCTPGGAPVTLPLPLPYCSICIRYSGMPGSVQAQATSVESESSLIVDSHAQNEGNGWAGSGANPWHLDEDTESVLFLTNESEKPARIGFKVSTGSSAPYYLTRLQLNPHETRALDMRKLRDAQQPDFKNHKIPAAATDGSVMWARLDKLRVMGHMIVVQHHQDIAGDILPVCPCPLSYDPGLNYVTPETLDLLLGETLDFTFYGAFEDCNENIYYYDEDDWADWTSEYPDIATVNSSGAVTGQSGGTTQITAEFSDYDYTYNSLCPETLVPGGGGGTANVFPRITSISPTYALVGTNNVQITINGEGFASNATVNLPSGFTSSTGCSQGNKITSTQIVTCVNISLNRAIQTVSFSVTNPAGSTYPGTSNAINFIADGPWSLVVVSDQWITSSNYRQVTYQVITLAKQTIPGIPIGEVVSTSNCNCTGGCPSLSFDQCGGGLTTSLQSDIVDSWGRFPSGYSPAGCGFNIVDHWQWCGTGAPTGGWTIGSPTGYIHTNASCISGYVQPGNPMPAGLVIPP
jgi:hypothetical protein